MIVAILNCYSPATGANLAQIVVHDDGPLQIKGDDGIARFRLGQVVNAPLPATPAPPAYLPRLHPRRRSLKKLTRQDLHSHE